MAEASWPRPAHRRPIAERLRAKATTTPGRLRIAMAVLVVAAALAGLVAGAATSVRRDAADAVATRDEPLMVDADGLYASLSDADATAAATFLTGGVESPARRARYLADLRRASLQLTALARRVQDSPEAAGAVGAVAAQLPVYSGLMETARANNRQGFPVGAAYLRQASDLMRGQILTAARGLYAIEAARLGDHQHSGLGSGGLTVTLIVCLAGLGLLVAVQVALARRTHRILNAPLVAATVALLALTAWVAIAMTSAREGLATAQREGSDSVQVLSAARILALRAQADESLALVARGGGDRYVADFEVVADVLGLPANLLGRAATLAERSGTRPAVDRISADWAAFHAAHRRVARLEQQGRFGAAIRLAVGPGSPEAAVADRLDRGFATQIAAAQQRFERSARDARSSLDGLAVGIPLLALLVAGLSIAGLQPRINEYR